eukprot:TRINITY_DN2738_c0_g1_i1.p1 TRINITY_DN2738_c0_g1~~TRINITY_DN2738_c0_g1_i1.p1  ORF type:complete len:355 (-),score=101.42 TRINITY_DN2738_c0_g1_i1:85-1053(-)
MAAPTRGRPPLSATAGGPTATAGRPNPHMYPGSAQAKLLDNFSEHVTSMPQVYEEALRNRDLNQKHLTEMIEDTLKHIQKAQAHTILKARHVRDTSTSYAAKFEHDIYGAREEMRRDLADRTAKIEGAVEALEGRIGELEEDLERQREFRMQHTEEVLGPIRDEVARLTAALETERRERRLEESRREKMLNEQVDDFTRLLDAEKFDRGQHLASFERFTGERQRKLEKRQYQVEQETADTINLFNEELKAASQERIRVQHQVIESIASFVKRYHEQLSGEFEGALSAGQGNGAFGGPAGQYAAAATAAMGGQAPPQENSGSS